MATTRACDIKEARSKFIYNVCNAEIKFIENNEALTSIEGKNSVFDILRAKCRFVENRIAILKTMIAKQQATKGNLIKKSGAKSKSVVASQKTEVAANSVVIEEDVTASI